MSLDRLTSILPAQFFEGAPQDVAHDDNEQQPAVEVQLGESAANKPSASSSAYDDEDFDMFSANENEEDASSVTSSSYGWMNNMKPKKYGGSYLVAFLFFLVFVMVISMASVGIAVHRQNKSVMMTSNAAIIEDCAETKASKRVRALASSPDAAAATAASTQGDEKNGREGIEQRLLKGDQVKRGLGVPSPTPVKGDAVVPSPTPVERVLGGRCSPNSVGSTPVGDICTQSPASAKCNNSGNSNCASCSATECPDGVTWICGQDGDTNFNLEKCPSEKPSQQPSESPSESPSTQPSESPTESPSKQPSKSPSDAPSKSPSKQPSDVPSKQPSDAPSESPSVSLQPSVSSAPSTVSYFYTL